ncbi:MAG: GldG family protein, partial [Clostridia bacterium]|nr:GldG family protein [Clostridia bacterium]
MRKKEEMTPNTEAMEGAGKAPKKNSFFSSRKFKYGSVATALTAVMVVVVVIVNIIFSMLADTYSWRLDLTSTDIYEIADETKQIVNTMVNKQDDVEQIEVIILQAESEFPTQYAENIKRFCNLSEKISYTYVNTVVNPQILEQYKQDYAEYNIQEGYIVVKNGDRVRVITDEDMYAYSYDYSTGGYVITEITIQNALVSAVLYVTKDEIPVVYFVTGHGEEGFDGIMKLIANNGADVQQIKLSQKTEFDDNAKVLFVCGPTTDYSEQEMALLESFVLNDNRYERDIFYFHNPYAPALPRLEAFLEEWGMKVENNLVMEDESHSVSVYDDASAPLYILPEQTGSAISEVEDAKIVASYECLMPKCSAITPLIAEGETKGMTEVVSLLKSYDTSWAKASDKLNIGYSKEDGDAEGPFTLGAIATRYKYESNT